MFHPEVGLAAINLTGIVSVVSTKYLGKSSSGFSITQRVIGAVLEVSNALGAGFLEKVYQRARLAELGLRGIRATAQASFAVTDKGRYAGEYFADILV